MSGGSPTRRDLLMLAGLAGGAAMAYRGMSAYAATPPSPTLKPGMLSPGGKKARVLVLGAGMAGLVAATELRAAGHSVEILEYNDRPGGRAWTIRGGDVIEEMGGARQICRFDDEQYFNPGAMRIPYDHHLFLGYCSKFNVALEAFAQDNGAAYFHSTKAFGGKPQRARDVRADFEGSISELLAKAAPDSNLDAELSKEDLEMLLEALRSWGALDKDYRYREGPRSTGRRGAPFGPPGGGLTPRPGVSKPIALKELLGSGLWRNLATQHSADWQPTMLQPVGGMDMLPRALARPLASQIRYRAKVVNIDQNDSGVRVTYADLAAGGATRTVEADWCVCTIPASILSQIPMKISGALQDAINSVWYASSLKVALQFKRRFWEQDERIYGGISFTDLPINQIVYPSHHYGSRGKGVLTGAFVVSLPSFQPLASYAMSSVSPEERIAWAVREGARIHPQYAEEFDNGVSVAWHRVPSALGCFASWHKDEDEKKYETLCSLDGRIMLAGEHCSYHSGWQEGAIASALDAAQRLHSHVNGAA
ncbi:flavin monoamine oxidase family protein [Sphingopyxis sp. LARHCG72]